MAQSLWRCGVQSEGLRLWRLPRWQNQHTWEAKLRRYFKSCSYCRVWLIQTPGLDSSKPFLNQARCHWMSAIGRIRKFWRLAANDILRMEKIAFLFLTFTERYLSPSTEHFALEPSDDGVAVLLVAYYLRTVFCVMSKCHWGDGKEQGARWETKRAERMLSAPSPVRKDVLAPGDNLCVRDPGKLIFLCRGLQTKFPRNVA